MEGLALPTEFTTHTHTLNPAKKYIQSNQIKQIEEEEEIIKTFSLV